MAPAVEHSRLERMLEILAQASLENYKLSLPISEQDDDAFLELEVAVNILLEDLALAKRHDEAQRQEIARQSAQLTTQQSDLVRALSTPIMVVWPGVLTLPIIGAVETERASAMTEAMLTRVVAERASHVILDLTGAGTIERGTARALLKMAQAVQMLGARCLITGISCEMAQALAGLDFDSTQVRTLPQISDAILCVFAEKGQRLLRSRPDAPKEQPKAPLKEQNRHANRDH